MTFSITEFPNSNPSRLYPSTIDNEQRHYMLRIPRELYIKEFVNPEEH